jgi:acetyl-CoA carboxylase biotin carboxyl carrier protein
MPLTQEQIIDLIKLVNKTDIGEIRIKDGDFSVRITHKSFCKNQVVHAPATPAAQVSATAAETNKPVVQANTPANAQHVFTMKSPMIGSFFRAAGPDKEPFVKVGDVVEKGQVLCIIEAMKLFNEIESEVSGIITKVLVENASPVEYDQPLFLIDTQ